MREATPATPWALWGEPSLDDLMADPIVHAVMRRDGLDEAFVRRIVEQAAARIRPGAYQATA